MKQLTIIFSTVFILGFGLVIKDFTPKHNVVIHNYLPPNIKYINQDKYIIKQNKVHFRNVYRTFFDDENYKFEELFQKFEYSKDGLLIRSDVFITDHRRLKSRKFIYDNEGRLSQELIYGEDRQANPDSITYTYNSNNNIKSEKRSVVTFEGNRSYNYFGNKIIMIEKSIPNEYKSIIYLNSNGIEIETHMLNQAKQEDTTKTIYIYDNNQLTIKKTIFTPTRLIDSTHYYYTTSNRISKELKYSNVKGQSVFFENSYYTSGLLKEYRVTGTNMNPDITYTNIYEFYE